MAILYHIVEEIATTILTARLGRESGNELLCANVMWYLPFRQEMMPQVFVNTTSPEHKNNISLENCLLAFYRQYV